MSNVHFLDQVTRLDLPAGRVIAKAAEAGLQDVVVIGYDADGELYFAANMASGPEALWLLRVAEKRLLEAAGE